MLEEVRRRADRRSKLDFRALCTATEEGWAPGRLHAKQLAFIEDDSPLVAATTSRRGGKSEGVAFKLIKGALSHPENPAIYITLTRPQAKRNMWPKLLRWNKRLALGGEPNHADLTLTFPGGGQVLLGGANDAGEVERWRGLDKGACIAVLDEAQAFRPYIRTLVEDILHPTMLETRGTIVLIGTPNPQRGGFFYEAYHNCGEVQGWSTHHWTVLDNPHVPHDPGKWLEEEVCGRRRLPKTHPKYRREWGGEWVRDVEGLVFPIPDFALVEDWEPGPFDWRYVLAMDVGYVDATAFVVLAYSVDTGRVVVVESHQRTEMIPSAICAEVDRMSTTYDFDDIVVDPGGGGKFIIEELKKRWELPAKAAMKRTKAAAIDILNGDLRAGLVSIVRGTNADLLHDASLLQWDYARLEKKGGAVLDLKSKDLMVIDDRTPDHLCDAFLYGHRECRQYLHESFQNDPKPGTREAFEAEERAQLQKLEERITADASAVWWEQGY